MSLSPDGTVLDLFLSACGSGKYELVKVLLANGAHVGWKEDGTLMSGLHKAAANRQGHVVALLLAQPGVDVNVRDSFDLTPLIFASVVGSDDIVRKLLQAPSTDLSCVDVTGVTALHLAIYNSPSCAKLLIEAGADCNVKDLDGDNAVTLAVFECKPDLLKILLSLPDHRVDLTVVDGTGKSVVWLAVENEEEDDGLKCVELLVQDARVEWNSKNQAGDTPLVFCLKKGKTKMARILLNNPLVDIHTKNEEGKYPENIAREQNLSEILELMRDLSRERELRDSLQGRLSECPVCFEKFNKNSRVYQCSDGHFVCGLCKPGVSVCPTCRGGMLGRAHGFEDHLQKLDM